MQGSRKYRHVWNPTRKALVTERHVTVAQNDRSLSEISPRCVTMVQGHRRLSAAASAVAHAVAHMRCGGMRAGKKTEPLPSTSPNATRRHATTDLWAAAVPRWLYECFSPPPSPLGCTIAHTPDVFAIGLHDKGSALHLTLSTVSGIVEWLRIWNSIVAWIREGGDFECRITGLLWEFVWNCIRPTSFKRVHEELRLKYCAKEGASFSSFNDFSRSEIDLL